MYQSRGHCDLSVNLTILSRDLAYAVRVIQAYLFYIDVKSQIVFTDAEQKPGLDKIFSPLSIESLDKNKKL